MLSKIIHVFCFTILALGFLSCYQCPKNPNTTTYLNKGPCKEYYEILRLDALPDSIFYYCGPGPKPGIVICGHWIKRDDSVFLTVEDPFKYEIKKSFVHYEKYRSSDSVYFMFFGLNPKIISYNSVYPSIPTDLIEDCSQDTLPLPFMFKTKELSYQTFNETICIPKKYYKKELKDTIVINFDIRNEFIDRSIPVDFGNNNCIKVFIARKPLFNYYYFHSFPTRYSIKGNKLIYTADDKNKTIFIKQ